MKNKEQISAALRALSKTTVDVGFQLTNEGEAKISPKTVTLPEIDDVKKLREVADSVAAKLRFHNEELHQKLKPRGSEQSEIFDTLETARAEALLAKKYDGVFANLMDSRIRDDYSIAATIGKIFWHKALNIPKVGETLLEKWIDENAPTQFAKLFDSLSNQKEFAKAASDFIRILETKDNPEKAAEQNKSDDTKPDEQEQQEQDDNDDSSDDSDSRGGDSKSSQTKEISAPDAKQKKGEKVEAANQVGNRPNYEQEVEYSYKVYTKQFDQIMRAPQLASYQELTKLRAQLDQKMANLKTITNKLAARLQQLLMSQTASWWEFDKEDGSLDPKRLSRLIATPEYHNIYKVYKESDFKDTVVTLLLDNSGSMRGRPIVSAVACADILAKVLEQCGVRVEILGFTTVEWKGGKARQLWQKNGAPKNPGRLNDLLHIIYKSADEPWRRAKRNLSLALKDGLLKENIDGEAIAWAYSRLTQRPESRKILMVISDGAPVDDSTISVNSPNFLDNHLRQMVKQIESSKRLELLAIGIGHDVGRYYKNAITIRDISDLGETIIGKMEELFGGKKAA